MMKQLVNRIIGNLKTWILRIRVAAQEKKYSGNGIEVKYIFKRKQDSRRLIVVFSAFAGHEVKARYNYLRTLKHVQENQLYILDDFGYHQVGSYYLGDSCKLYEADLLTELIRKIASKCNADEIIYAGSSKGGSAALIYGFKNNADHILIGSPQYHLGEYLSENEYHEKIRDAIIGGTKYDKSWLDALVETCMKNSDKKSVVHLMYSSKEASYERDVSCLIDDMIRNGIRLEAVDAGYESHGDTGVYFSAYLKDQLQQLMLSKSSSAHGA